MPLFVTLSVLAGFGGLLFLSNATAGVGLIAFALLMAVFARLLQADKHHRALLQRSQPNTLRDAPPAV